MLGTRMIPQAELVKMATQRLVLLQVSPEVHDDTIEDIDRELDKREGEQIERGGGDGPSQGWYSHA